MTTSGYLGSIAPLIGLSDVLHRLALVIEPMDAVTGRPTTGVRVGRETPGRDAKALRRYRAGTLDPLVRTYPASRIADSGGARFVVRHGPLIKDQLRIRLDDPYQRWLPRRLDVELWNLDSVAAADPMKPGQSALGTYIPPTSRLLRPWLLPGWGYPTQRGLTGARLIIDDNGAPVPWVRLVAFGTGGRRVGSAHGNATGRALLLVPGSWPIRLGNSAQISVVLRMYAPTAKNTDPRRPPPARVGDGTSNGVVSAVDPLSNLVIEKIPRSQVPASSNDLDNDVLRGVAPPPGYRTAKDVVVTLTVGEITPDVVVSFAV